MGECRINFRSVVGMGILVVYHSMTMGEAHGEVSPPSRYPAADLPIHS